MKQNLNFLATAVGSLPHTDPEEAVEMIFNTFSDAPVLPQLAKVCPKEDMTSQLNENIPGVVYDETDKRWYIDQESETFFEQIEEFFLDYENIVNENDLESLEKYAISESHCSALPYFLKKLAAVKPAYVKGQIIGPFTFGTSLVDREKKCAFYDETLKEIITKALTLKALWLVKKFREASPESKIILFMDEPTISQYGTSAFITVKKEDLVSCFSEIAAALKAAGVLSGIHCCGKSDWSVVIESNIDILNFDGFYFGESLGLYSKEIANFLNNGGKIAWGIVPTLDVDSLEVATEQSLTEKYEEAISYLVNKNINKDVILESTIITPSCGAGSLNRQQAERAMQLTAALAKALSLKYPDKTEKALT